MPKLAGNLPVHVVAPGHPITTIWPNEEIPEWAFDQLEPALKGEGEAPAPTGSPASSGAPDGALTEEQLRELTNDQLRERLGEGNYTSSDRKDELVAKALQAQQPSGD